MFRASIQLLAIAAILCAPVPSVAGETRIVPGRSEAQFNPVGRLTSRDLEDGGGCSGTLISPELVLTAAHCVPRTGNVSARRLSKMTFAAGWGNSEAIAIRQAVAVYVHPDYRPDANGLGSIAYDIAIVRLARPIEDIPPMSLGPKPAALMDVTIAGYTHRARQALTVSDGCAHFTRLDRLLFLTCPVIGGHSGGPILAGPAEDRNVVAVVSSRTDGGAFAPLLDDWVTGFLDDPPF